MEALINMVLLTLMAIISIGVIRQQNLFAVVILFGIYSFLMASVLIVLDAPDVAMTEASVGAGISTVLMLGTLYLTKVEERPVKSHVVVPLLLSAVTGAALIYGTLGLPPFGIADSPMNTHLGAEFLQRTYPETHVPNVVTAVLASYRGFDTLGEVAVVFTAGIGVMLLLRGKRSRKTARDEEGKAATGKNAAGSDNSGGGKRAV